MRYYKIINDGYLISVGTGIGGTEIIGTEYNVFLSIIHDRPTPQTGYDYKLKADTLDWELVELPPIDDTDDDANESDYIDALNTLGVDTNEEN